jgi:WD40 repeat protein
VLVIWDTQQAREVFRREGRWLDLDPDVRYVAMIEGPQYRWVTVWDVATRRELFTLKGHSARVHTTAFSADGQRLATACGEWEEDCPLDVRLWDVQTGPKRSLWKARRRMRSRSLSVRVVTTC